MLVLGTTVNALHAAYLLVTRKRKNKSASFLYRNGTFSYNELYWENESCPGRVRD